MVNKDGLFGYVNEKGQIAIAPKYKAAKAFSNGAAVVLVKTEDGKSYFDIINTKGETLFKFNTGQYSDISNFNNGYAFAVEGDHVVLLDKQGKKVATVGNGTDIKNLSCKDGKLIYTDGEYFGLKDIEGNILLRAKYGSLEFVGGDNLLACNSNGKYGVVNTKDDIILPFDYDDLQFIAPDRYLTTSGSLKVMINNSGKEVCKVAFQNVVNRNESYDGASQTWLISSDNNNADTNFDANQDLESLINGAFDGFGYDMSTYGQEGEGDSGTIEGSTFKFSGEVGSYPIEMTLTFDNNDKVSGTYKYTNSGNGEYIALNGTYYIVDYGYEAQVTLQEYYNGNLSATWSLEVVHGSSTEASGTMVTSAGKNFNVTLVE